MTDNNKRTDEKIIHEFQKNAEEKVVTSFCVYRGKKLVNIRAYYEAEDGWRPTRHGLTLRRSMILDLKEAIDKAAAEYEKELPGSEEPGTDEETTKEADIQKPKKDDQADIHPA
jgi:hypothetical protein